MTTKTWAEAQERTSVGRPAAGPWEISRMDVPVIVGNRLRYRIRWRLIRLWRREDGYELGIWGHPALLVAMTPAGFEFSQVDWYSFTLSYKRRRLLPGEGGQIEPARFLAGLTFRWLGFAYVAVFLSDWRRMLRAGQVPFEAGRLLREPPAQKAPAP